ncbi:SdpI family protein [Caproicibacter fermentans]|uniref:DUF1648 domain-containing protein n=1 Tax=Caproicibacter fermentans TaxID=2576756 RepID=A0A7G8TE22_9FIRM|nr:SdpI family protein [Caproicibacter fermentans]QNK41863.1 DUF1648 domain-containing protein [Caproicibacter fermentans]
MKKLKKSDLFYWFFAVLPFLISAAFYPYLPDQIADHWNSAGAADGYSSKAFALFFTPAFLMAVTLFVGLMFRIDPQKENINRSVKLKTTVLWFLVLLNNAVNLLTIAYAFHKRLNTTAIIFSFLGAGLAVAGNYLPKCKYNYTMGIRVPWTLASESNWEKTHRMAGPIWVAGGVLIAPMIYSYAIFRRGN